MSIPKQCISARLKLDENISFLDGHSLIFDLPNIACWVYTGAAWSSTLPFVRHEYTPIQKDGERLLKPPECWDHTSLNRHWGIYRMIFKWYRETIATDCRLPCFLSSHCRCLKTIGLRKMLMRSAKMQAPTRLLPESHFGHMARGRGGNRKLFILKLWESGIKDLWKKRRENNSKQNSI